MQLVPKSGLPRPVVTHCTVKHTTHNFYTSSTSLTLKNGQSPKLWPEMVKINGGYRGFSSIFLAQSLKKHTSMTVLPTDGHLMVGQPDGQSSVPELMQFHFLMSPKPNTLFLYCKDRWVAMALYTAAKFLVGVCGEEVDRYGIKTWVYLPYKSGVPRFNKQVFCIKSTMARPDSLPKANLQQQSKACHWH